MLRVLSLCVPSQRAVLAWPQEHQLYFLPASRDTLKGCLLLPLSFATSFGTTGEAPSVPYLAYKIEHNNIKILKLQNIFIYTIKPAVF